MANDECVVCYDEDTKFICERKHKLCVTCVRQLLLPCKCDGDGCVGISYKCPICRANSGMDYEGLFMAFGEKIAERQISKNIEREESNS